MLGDTVGGLQSDFTAFPFDKDLGLLALVLRFAMTCDTSHPPRAIFQCALLLDETAHLVVVYNLTECILSDLTLELDTLRILVTLALELFNKLYYPGSVPLTIFLGIE